MLVIKYQKTGRSKFISHLDLLKQMGKILRRANVAVEFSKGFNPHEILYFSPACVVGSTSECEYMVVATSMDKGEFLQRFNSVAIEGVVGTAVYEVAKNPNLAAICERADYKFPATAEEVERIKKAFESESFEITFTQKGEEKTQDVREKMFSYSYEGGICTINLATGNNTLRTDRLLPALGILASAHRTKLQAKFQNKIMDVDDVLSQLQI